MFFRNMIITYRKTFFIVNMFGPKNIILQGFGSHPKVNILVKNILLKGDSLRKYFFSDLYSHLIRQIFNNVFINSLKIVYIVFWAYSPLPSSSCSHWLPPPMLSHPTDIPSFVAVSFFIECTLCCPASPGNKACPSLWLTFNGSHLQRKLALPSPISY